MFKDFKKSGPGAGRGFNKFAARKPFGGDRGGDSFRPELHKATCAECGNACMVPFKPNGKKPIFCSNCFVREDGGDRPAKRFNDDRPARSSSFSGGSNDEQFRMLNAKLDRILKLIEEDAE